MGGGKKAQTSYCLGFSCFLAVLCLFFVAEAKSGGRRKRCSNVALFRSVMLFGGFGIFLVVESKSGGRRKKGSNVVLFRIGVVFCAFISRGPDAGQYNTTRDGVRGQTEARLSDRGTSAF